jgi:hypothetical protein
LDRVLIFGERHLWRVLTSYSVYYNETRTHLGLGKDAPLGRAIEPIRDRRCHTRFCGSICGREFNAESIRLVGIALECARSALSVFPSDEALSEASAARIIELARTGERDPDKLCDFAIAALKTPPALEPEDG